MCQYTNIIEVEKILHERAEYKMKEKLETITEEIILIMKKFAIPKTFLCYWQCVTLLYISNTKIL